MGRGICQEPPLQGVGAVRMLLRAARGEARQWAAGTGFSVGQGGNSEDQGCRTAAVTSQPETLRRICRVGGHPALDQCLQNTDQHQSSDPRSFNRFFLCLCVCVFLHTQRSRGVYIRTVLVRVSLLSAYVKCFNEIAVSINYV